MSPSTHNMEVPVVKRDEYTLMNIDDGFLNLVTTDGTPKDDVKVPEGELGEQILAHFKRTEEDESGSSGPIMVTILNAMGEEAAIAVKEGPKEN
jgi:translation initiation factor 5A